MNHHPVPHVTVADSDYLVTVIVGDTHLTMTPNEARKIADAIMKAARQADKNCEEQD